MGSFIKLFTGGRAKKTADKTKPSRIIFAMSLTLALTLGFVIYSLMPRLPEQSAPIENGVIDLTGIDLNSVIAKLSMEWDYYPGELYGPADFAEGRTGEPRQFRPEDEHVYRTGTYRAVLKVIPGKTYAMNEWSLDYATRVFADGIGVLDIGTVAGNAGDFVPQVRNYILPLIPQSENIEIIIQYANFSHHEGGAMREITFGSFENVNSFAESRQNSALMVGGSLLLVAAFYFMLAVSGRGFKNLAFALCCFFLATRSQQFILSLMPLNYNWSFIYRFVYINNICTGLAFLLLCYSLYPATLPKRVIRPAVWITAAVTLGLTASSLFIPLPMVARLVAPSYLVFIPAIICICWTFGKQFIKGRSVDRITSSGIAILFITLIAEMLLQRSVPEITRSGLAPFGMLTFAICQMLALGMENEMLERLNRMKTEFLQDMSHEMQNPLTVIATGVDFAGKNIEGGGDTVETCDALAVVQDETQRLGRMVRGMVQLAEMDETNENRKRADFAALLKSSAEAFRLPIEKQNNSLTVDIPQDLPDVFVEVDKFKQVMTNLFSNAARHTREGCISLTAECDDSYITVRVTDTGEGIEPNILSGIYERGISGIGGTGYGLYLCRTIIEAHGGTIEIESEPGKGTAVSFTVPVYGGQDVLSHDE